MPDDGDPPDHPGAARATSRGVQPLRGALAPPTPRTSPGFSAAGIYESVNHRHQRRRNPGRGHGRCGPPCCRRAACGCASRPASPSTTPTWASSSRSRSPPDLGGVLVTMQPDATRTTSATSTSTARRRHPDGRRRHDAAAAVPLQHRRGRRPHRVARLDAAQDLPDATRDQLAGLALDRPAAPVALLGDTTSTDPLDIEWLMTDQGDFRLVQLRPYAL